MLQQLFLVTMAALVALPVWAKDADFNGRWNITPASDARKRAWWLEVNGAGTSKMTGRFVSALRGDMNVIENLTLRDGTLHFSFERPEGQGPSKSVAKLMYSAKLVKGQLEGVYEIEGRPQTKMQWTGRRAPAIADKEDGKWKQGAAVNLFNGKDLSNWEPMIPGKALGWQVKDGVMVNEAGANNLVSREKFWNFELDCEFRIGAGSNGGLGLRGRYEVQIVDDFGQPADSHGTGALYSRITPKENASKKPGEWQRYQVRLVGRTVTVVVNGKTVIDKGEVEGLTAMAHDANEAEPGPLSVQGDHGSVEIRKLVVTPLYRK